MKKINSKIKSGTKVLIEGIGWCVVNSVHESRNTISVKNYVGSFQSGHINKFTNVRSKWFQNG